jgi:hypothetical protein
MALLYFFGRLAVASRSPVLASDSMKELQLASSFFNASAMSVWETMA